MVSFHILNSLLILFFFPLVSYPYPSFDFCFAFLTPLHTSGSCSHEELKFFVINIPEDGVLLRFFFFASSNTAVNIIPFPEACSTNGS